MHIDGGTPGDLFMRIYASANQRSSNAVMWWGRLLEMGTLDVQITKLVSELAYAQTNSVGLRCIHEIVVVGQGAKIRALVV